MRAFVEDALAVAPLRLDQVPDALVRAPLAGERAVRERLRGEHHDARRRDPNELEDGAAQAHAPQRVDGLGARGR